MGRTNRVERGRQNRGEPGRKIYHGDKPLLKTSLKEKTEKDFLHSKNIIDYFIQSSFFQDETTKNSGNYRDLYILYNTYNNHLPEEYFHYVTNPLNSSNKSNTAYPARIRPYTIIRPNVDLLLGEYDKRPFNYTVVVNNPESVTELEEQIYDQVLASLEQSFINNLNDEGINTGQPTQEVEPPAEIKAKAESTYKDQRAIQGQNALAKLEDDLYLKEIYNQCFKDWIIAGECYTYKNVHHSEVIYERVSPLDIDYDKSPDNEYVEDSSWVVRRMYLTAPDVVDMFYEEMTGKDIDNVEEEDASTYFSSTYFNTLFGNTYRQEEDLRRSKLDMYHVCWKSYEKIGILTYIDELGQIQEMEVPETYKPDKTKGESIEWIWVTQVWEGYRLDVPPGSEKPHSKASSQYFRIRPIPAQRNRLNWRSGCKMPYNGKRFSDIHARNISIVELGIPYEILYIILHYRLELTLAKSKGKIALLDINTIPNKKGWDEEKFLYWADANGFAFIDRNQIGADKSFNQYQALDMSMFDHIANLVEVMQFIKQEWDDVIGITRQRKGQVQASETASGVDAARFQSSVISERVFSRYEEFIQRELRGLLDCSKLAWIDGKKAIFYGSDMRNILLNIQPESFVETDFGVFTSNSSDDLENLKLMREQVTALASQGAPGSTLAEVVQARNISKLTEILKEAEMKELEKQQAIEQTTQEAELKKLEIEQQYQAIAHEFELALQNNEYDRKEGIELIKGDIELQKANATIDANNNDIPDINEVEKRAIEREKISSDQLSKQNEMQLKNKELELKNKEIDSKERIENKKAQVALKNKVVGEK